VIDARAEGRILDLPVAVGEPVRRGQPLVRLYLPALEQQVRRQEKDLGGLIRIDAEAHKKTAEEEPWCWRSPGRRWRSPRWGLNHGRIAGSLRGF